MSMADPRGGAASVSGSSHHLVDEDMSIMDPQGGAADRSSSGHHLVDEDIDGGPPEGAVDRSGAMATT
jgi:hypothetical protein